MAFGTAAHGINGLIYVSGTEIPGANGWSIAIDTEFADYRIFGDDWVNHVVGLTSWSGSIAAVHDQDAKLLQDAATARAAVSLLIYPASSDSGTYYSGDAVFSFGSDASSDGVITQTSDFVGDGELTLTGFS